MNISLEIAHNNPNKLITSDTSYNNDELMVGGSCLSDQSQDLINDGENTGGS